MSMIMTDPRNYPRSNDFIAEMAQESVERIIFSGWSIKNTLFFEIPYCAVTGIGAGIARDYKNKVYYKIFCATEGVIASLTDTQLQVVAEHEQDEVNQSISQAVDNSAKAAFSSSEDEIQRHKIEMLPIERRYGKDTVNDTIQRVNEVSSTKTVIPRYVLIFWISHYLLDRFKQLKEQSFSMTPAMLSKKQISFFIQNLNKVRDEYRSDSPIEAWLELYLSVVHPDPSA